jgi:hypothetical protein
LSKGLVQAKQTVVDHAVFVEDLLLQSPVVNVLQETLVEPLRWNNGGSNNSDVGVSPTGRRSPTVRDRCSSWDNVRMAANRSRTSSSRNSSPGPFTALQQQSDYVHQIPRGTILLFGCTIEINLDLSKPGLFAFTIRAAAESKTTECHLAAPTAELRDYWVDALAVVCRGERTLARRVFSLDHVSSLEEDEGDHDEERNHNASVPADELAIAESSIETGAYLSEEWESLMLSQEQPPADPFQWHSVESPAYLC